MPGPIGERRLAYLKQKHAEGEPLISDSQISRVICQIDPLEIESILHEMTIRCRRNKTWDWKSTAGRKVVAYDGSSPCRSRRRCCSHCKGKEGGPGYYHLGVHLRQVGQEPEMSMGYRAVPRGKGELTVAKEMASER